MSERRRRRAATDRILVGLLAATCASWTLAGPLAAQVPEEIHRSSPPSGATTHTMVPGERYRASGLGRWLFGSDYRQVWTTPVEVPVLELDRVGGGLTAVTTGGFGQSITLELTGRDGTHYAVRSLDRA